MKFLSLLFFMFCNICSTAYCNSEVATPGAEQLFTEANAFYGKGDYAKAIEDYEKILSGGMESGPVYYNLGNAYFKSGNTAKAILNYGRAKRIIPRDADLSANYKFAKSRIISKVLEDNSIFMGQYIKAYSENFTINELTLISSGAFILVLIFILLAILLPAAGREFFAAAILLSMFMAFNIAVVRDKVDHAGKDCITVASESDAMFGPFESSTKYFSIHEGMPVTIVDSKDEWYKLRRSDGKTGWVKKSAVEVV